MVRFKRNVDRGDKGGERKGRLIICMKMFEYFELNNIEEIG